MADVEAGHVNVDLTKGIQAPKAAPATKKELSEAEEKKLAEEAAKQVCGMCARE